MMSRDHTLNTYKGSRQGDSLSPLLFYFVIDSFAIIMNNARVKEMCKGVKVEDGINILQYADETIILLSNDINSA
jgi:hypothetical protein